MKTNQQPSIKNEIITLILADMRSRKLMMGLDAIGLSTDDFNSNLSELIFSKLGIAKEHEALMSNWYEDMIFNILDIELNTFREHQVFLAMTMYETLQEKSKELQIKLLLTSKSNMHTLEWTALPRFDN